MLNVFLRWAESSSSGVHFPWNHLEPNTPENPVWQASPPVVASDSWYGFSRPWDASRGQGLALTVPDHPVTQECRVEVSDVVLEERGEQYCHKTRVYVGPLYARVGGEVGMSRLRGGVD